jgi:2-keto-4-pentenoate hydratase/2-oxohepta-3-ene-1,7-dioic acid hydratase in catechol pathway
MGPVLVSPDEFENPDDLELGCSVNGTSMQKSRTSDMIFTIP